MDEPTSNKAEAEQPQEKKEWLTPELIIEDVNDVTLGGSGRARNLATEEKITTYYHS